MEIRATQILLEQHEYNSIIAENATLKESNLKLQTRVLELEQAVKDLQTQINTCKKKWIFSIF